MNNLRVYIFQVAASGVAIYGPGIIYSRLVGDVVVKCTGCIFISGISFYENVIGYQHSPASSFEAGCRCCGSWAIPQIVIKQHSLVIKTCESINTVVTGIIENIVL